MQETDFCTLFVREEMSEYDVPYGSLADLLRFLDGLLDSYDEQNLRKWRKGSIREDEIWIKIGGDLGKYSLIFTFQIANTAKPNARHNTVVIAIATVRDTHDNIVRLLEGGLGNDLSPLQSHCWRDKTIKVFLNGDYEFMCKMYGLSDPQDTYLCLWSLMPRRDMHQPSDQCQCRSMETLLADDSPFHRETSDKREAAKFHNSLYAPLLELDLESADPPYLHILQGVVSKHHKLLEDSARRLDMEIDLESADPPYLHVLQGVVSKHHKLLEDSVHRLDMEIDLGSADPPYLHILQGVVSKHHKLLEDSARRLDMEIDLESADPPYLHIL